MAAIHFFLNVRDEEEKEHMGKREERQTKERVPEFRRGEYRRSTMV